MHILLLLFCLLVLPIAIFAIPTSPLNTLVKTSGPDSISNVNATPDLKTEINGLPTDLNSLISGPVEDSSNIDDTPTSKFETLPGLKGQNRQAIDVAAQALGDLAEGIRNAHELRQLSQLGSVVAAVLDTNTPNQSESLTSEGTPADSSHSGLHGAGSSHENVESSSFSGRLNNNRHNHHNSKRQQDNNLPSISSVTADLEDLVGSLMGTIRTTAAARPHGDSFVSVVDASGAILQAVIDILETLDHSQPPTAEEKQAKLDAVLSWIPEQDILDAPTATPIESVEETQTGDNVDRVER